MFKEGDVVSYFYPDSLNEKETSFYGIIEKTAESFVITKNDENITLKVSSKNFDQIFLVTNKSSRKNLITEKFFG